MKHEIQLFFTALMFYTRIPCPAWLKYHPDYLNQCTRYFPLIGVLVGSLQALVLWGAAYVLPLSVAVLLSMGATLLCTGAFHEDGLADACDGFGGGWTKERILEIMKDSRIGTFGAVGLGIALALKYQLLLYLAEADIFVCMALLVWVHSSSRLMAATTLFTHQYVRENEDAKAKPLAKEMSIKQLFLMLVVGLVSFVCFWFLPLYALFLLLPMYAAKAYLAAFFKKWIGGYTGDCLGAIQQVAEITAYLGAALMLYRQIW